MPSLFKKPAVFFDRDGVINEEKNYVFKEKQFIFKKNVPCLDYHVVLDYVFIFSFSIKYKNQTKRTETGPAAQIEQIIINN